jgi:hypothetical protein
MYPQAHNTTQDYSLFLLEVTQKADPWKSCVARNDPLLLVTAEEVLN